ncbi:Putative arrestin-like protein [Septoria linicola]|uniref:Arrestin-like protein n=1 Tax=Septoria linicola TaxID=215465 RepID=A0A9Q9EL70_9PEZI|nr:Putative arrestin-like protein [Septoria linicola]
MGIFTRKERIPEPYVSVSLDEHCRDPILPGTQVSGNLLISSPTQRAVRSAEAVFSGRVTTSCIRYVNGPTVGANNRRTRRKVRYYDEVEILRQSQTLVEGISLDPTNALTLPFSFTCPDHTNFLTGASPYTAGYTNPEAYDTGAHALPPTLNHSHGSEHYAVVQYGVQLVVHFHDSQEPFLSAPQPIVICPRKTGLQGPLAEYITPAQKYSSSRLTGQQKSFMSSVKDKFSSETPSVNVVLKARTATVVPSGDSFVTQTCVEIDSFSTQGIDIPVVEICISQLKLLPVTFFRALKVSTYGWSSDRPEHEIVDEDKLILSIDG